MYIYGNGKERDWQQRLAAEAEAEAEAERGISSVCSVCLESGYGVLIGEDPFLCQWSKSIAFPLFCLHAELRKTGMELRNLFYRNKIYSKKKSGKSRTQNTQKRRKQKESLIKLGWWC